ncbi:MAG: N-glycosylase/DNA lyase [Elusimicrobia bacterium]|nr:N-glycosylase/DNA lyase [Candidatus Liberimonas magnetica]
MYDKTKLNELTRLWKLKKDELDKRLLDFIEVWEKASDRHIFPELVFCLFTPQSKAKTCWAAVQTLSKQNLLYKGKKNRIATMIGHLGVRFKNNKAGYVLEARKLLDKSCKNAIKRKIESFKDILEARQWLVKNVKGLGYKEASHFLRNLGLGENLAILDRHILKNLKALNVIDSTPKSLTEQLYLDIENKMLAFSKKSKIPMNHLDLLLWYKEAGEIFK